MLGGEKPHYVQYFHSFGPSICRLTTVGHYKWKGVYLVFATQLFCIISTLLRTCMCLCVGLENTQTHDLKSSISQMATSVFIFCVTAAGILAEQWDVVLPARKHPNARLHMMTGPGSAYSETRICLACTKGIAQMNLSGVAGGSYRQSVY